MGLLWTGSKRNSGEGDFGPSGSRWLDHVDRLPVVVRVGFVLHREPKARSDMATPEAADQDGLVTVIKDIVFSLKPAPVAIHLHDLLREQSRSRLAGKSGRFLKIPSKTPSPDYPATRRPSSVS